MLLIEIYKQMFAIIADDQCYKLFKNKSNSFNKTEDNFIIFEINIEKGKQFWSDNSNKIEHDELLSSWAWNGKIPRYEKTFLGINFAIVFKKEEKLEEEISKINAFIIKDLVNNDYNGVFWNKTALCLMRIGDLYYEWANKNERKIVEAKIVREGKYAYLEPFSK